METKYRVDFYYWNCDSGFSHIETVENINTLFNAKEYADSIDVDYFTEIPYDAIWVKIIDNENDYILSEYWWKLTEYKNPNKINNNKNDNHDENWYAIRYLTGDNVWVYEREAGDGGLVVAESYEKALDELRKVYDDIDERINPDCEKYTWGLNVLAVGDYESKGNVFITHPY